MLGHRHARALSERIGRCLVGHGSTVTGGGRRCEPGSTTLVRVAGTRSARCFPPIGRADVTLMPADQFDAFVFALEQPDSASGLAAAAARERRYRRR